MDVGVHQKPNYLSLQSQRSPVYLHAAVALLSVIPVLAAVAVMLSLYTDLLPSSNLLRLGASLSGVLAGVCGYLLLRVYPDNQARLRDYLAQMSDQQLPEHAQLLSGELDMRDLEYQLNRVIGVFQEKVVRLDEALQRSRALVQTIRAQSDEIVEAERQRVMIESLGAACHHIGQPTTVLSLYLSRLRDMQPEAFAAQDLEPCLEAVDSIAGILRKLKQVSEYRTVPYGSGLHAAQGIENEAGGMKILDIESAKNGQFRTETC